MSLFARTFAITSSAWFLFVLDRMVVITALPAIRTDLGADLTGTEWAVNAYTLSFAVLLLAGAALGDRFGRRQMFAVGMAIFTIGSAAAALAPSVGALVAARAVQGAGGAIFVPLSMTMLSAASPAARRGAVLGAWGGIGGLGVAAGPLLGGAVTDLAGWRWIFWLNVPLGLVLVPLAWRRLRESHGPHGRLDLRGVALSGAGVFGVVWAVSQAGWERPDVLLALGFGVLALVAFVVWQTRAPAPMLPMRFFRNRAFAAANLTALLKYAALFGALFLLTQLLQAGLGASPLEAGLRMLPMVVMPLLLTPVAGALSDRWGTRRMIALGAALVATGLAWLAAVTAPDMAYGALVPGMIMMGAGSALFFAPAAATVLGSVAPHEQGQAAGAATAVREIAVVLGVAVLASVFAANGDLGSPTRLVAGVVPALWLGAALAGAGVLAALALPRATAVPTPLVRTAGRGDHAAIREVLGIAYAQYVADIEPEVWDAFRADLLDLDRHAHHGQLMVAEIGGRIAGYAAFYPDVTVQNLGWPGGWAGGRGLAVHPDYRGQGVADALIAALEHRARESGAPVFAFHTSGFMIAALTLYARLGYRRAPEFDRDMNVHYGVDAGRPWPVLAYLKCLAPNGGTP